jgi:hypothetical protein
MSNNKVLLSNDPTLKEAAKLQRVFFVSDTVRSNK